MYDREKQEEISLRHKMQRELFGDSQCPFCNRYGCKPNMKLMTCANKQRHIQDLRRMENVRVNANSK